VSPRRFLLVLVGATAVGCVPYVTPPVTATLGLAHDASQGARTGFHADAGFSPWQVIGGQLDRSWDVTVSGSYDHLGGARWGGALAAGPVLHPWGLDPARALSDRVMPQLVGRWTTAGRSAGVRLILERAIFADTSGTAAAAWGEDAIGGYLEAGYLWTGDARDGWMIGLGVAGRLSATAGVACCLK
jgi:hypothetical protein